MKAASLSLILLLLFPQVTYAYCSEVARTCQDEGGTRVVDGQTVTRDCFSYKVEYMCDVAGGQEDSSCGDLRNQGCTEKGVECGDTDPQTGRCLFFNKTYDCPTKNQTESVDCSVSNFCQDGNCFDTSYDSNKDMGKAVAYLEMARMVQVEMEDGKLFKGDAHTCREGWGGIRKCCNRKPAPEAFSLSNQFVTGMMSSVALTTAKFAFTYTVPYASAFVYDQITNTLSVGMQNFIGWNASATSGAAKFFADGARPPGTAFTPSFGVMGFSATVAPTQAAAMAGTNTAVAGSNVAMGSVGNVHFIFNPVMFGIAAAFMIYQSLSSCNQNEHKLALYRGSGGCQEVPQAGYCDKKTLFGCMQRRKAFCCYNSIIAKTINHAAKNQLGMPKAFGKGKPNCRPITTADLMKVNFDKVDFSEFISSIAPGGKGSAFWEKKLKETEAQRRQAQVTCSDRPTQQERDACMKSVDYTDGGQYRSFESINYGEANPDNKEKHFQDRAQGRINLARDEDRPDTVRPPEGHDDGYSGNLIYDSTEEYDEQQEYINENKEQP